MDALIIDRRERWSLPSFDQDDSQSITDLLMGHTVTVASDDRLVLDDGTTLLVVANEGGCSCGAGDYVLDELNGIDNIITKVEHVVDSEDGSYEPDQTYRIFVYADNKKVNLLSVSGNDGNGYYGTGFDIIVKAVTS